MVKAAGHRDLGICTALTYNCAVYRTGQFSQNKPDKGMELSRSEQKRRIKQLAKLVLELVRLPPGMIDRLPVREEVRQLIRETGGLKSGARKRQLKYITKLLRSEPVEALYDVLSAQRGGELLRKKQFHEIEYLRDILVEEAITARRLAQEERRGFEEGWQSEVVRETIVAQFPDIDQQEITRLAFLFALTRNKKHSREIFRVFQAAGEQGEMNRKLQKP